MVAQGLFQPPLKTHIYINTLHQAEAELAKLQPANSAGGEEEEAEEGEGNETAAAGDADAAGAKWEEGDIHVSTQMNAVPLYSEWLSVFCLLELQKSHSMH